MCGLLPSLAMERADVLRDGREEAKNG